VNDLFRFLLLRPAVPATSDEVKTLKPSFTGANTSREAAKADASAYVAKNGVVRAEDLAYGKVGAAARQALADSPRKLADMVKAVEAAAGKKIAKVIGDAAFANDETRLADSLIAMKLLSDSKQGDAPALAQYAQGYDAIRRAAAGTDPMKLRPLTYGLPDRARDVPRSEPEPPKREPLPPPASDRKPGFAAIDAALGAFGRMRADAFDSSSEADVRLADVSVRLAALEKGRESRAEEKPLARPAASTLANPWTLSRAAVAALPSDVHDTLQRLGIDPLKQSYPALLADLHQYRTEAQAMMHPVEVATSIRKIGMSFQSVEDGKYVGSPSALFPTGHGSVRPVGIGDLLLVKQHVLRYEGGDLAHVENVMKTEHMERDTRG